MDYKVGSLAELISGNKTSDKTKIIQKTLKSLKKEPVDEPVPDVPFKSPKKNKVKPFKKNSVSPIKKETFDEPVPDVPFKSPKKNKVKPFKKNSVTPIKKEPVDESVPDVQFKGKSPKKNKVKPFKKKPTVDEVLNNMSETTLDTNKKLSKKAKKRKSNDKSNGLADSDDDQSPTKKQKLSENEQNAAGRIKNKLNQKNKNSGEYKDKTVFVGNIPIKTKKEKIKKRFRKYGEIDSVRFRGIPVADPKTSKKVAAIKEEFHPDRNTLYAFIRFKNANDAKKAEVENGSLFEENHLRVHCCESEDKPDESKAIFVGNLAFSAEEEELWNLFKPCGPISHVRIVRDGRTGMGKGFGYVNFKDTDSVQLALEMENVKLKERELRISLCDSTRAKKKKAPKKPRIRNRAPKSENQENSDSPKKTNTSVVGNIKHEQFSGSKFDDKKKKRKFNRSAIEKKKLAQKLVAPKPSVQ